jgi:hypothetical protein
MNESMDFLELWKPVLIEDDQILHWQVGPLELWVCRSGREWLVTSREDPEKEEGVEACVAKPVPEELDWRRWAGGEESNVVELVPATPPRPVVVRPRHPLAFPPASGGIFYARIPVWVRVTVGEGQAITLCEIPTVTLSNTWFGVDTTEGELCYAMKSAARADLGSVPPVPHRVICTLTLQNGAEGPLDFQRLCVRCEHLTIYGINGHLWGSQVALTYRGEGSESRVRYVEGQLEKRGGSRVLNPPRTPVSGSFFAKSFASLARLGRRI